MIIFTVARASPKSKVKQREQNLYVCGFHRHTLQAWEDGQDIAHAFANSFVNL